MKAMLLAAGEGTRLRPLTKCMPKPMLPIAGKPLLQRVVEWLTGNGIREIVINLHYRPEAITDYFGDGTNFGVQITYSYEPHLLGTAGAVKKVDNLFTETFLLVYGDNLTTCNLARLSEFHNQKGGIASMALYERRDVSQSGVAELDGNDRVIRFIEKPAAGATTSRSVSAGILMLETSILETIPPNRPCDFGHDILPQLIAKNASVYGYHMNKDERLWWIDTPEDYKRVCSQWERRKRR